MIAIVVVVATAAAASTAVTAAAASTSSLSHYDNVRELDHNSLCAIFSHTPFAYNILATPWPPSFPLPAGPARLAQMLHQSGQ